MKPIFLPLAALFLLVTLACNALVPSPRLPPANATSTPTPLPVHPISTATTAQDAPYAFHMHFALAESASCPASPCTVAYIPMMVLYFRGDFNVAENNAVRGDGLMTFISMKACETLHPELSSCQVTAVTDGSFTIRGERQGEQVQLFLHLEKMPGLVVEMTVQSPAGPVKVPLEAMYQEEMESTFESAGIFETPIWIPLTAGWDETLAYFEGAYTLNGVRTLEGRGNLSLIPLNLSLPERFLP